MRVPWLTFPALAGALFSTGTPLPAQDLPEIREATIHSYCEPATVRIGEPFTLVVDIVHSGRQRVLLDVSQNDQGLLGGDGVRLQAVVLAVAYEERTDHELARHGHAGAGGIQTEYFHQASMSYAGQVQFRPIAGHVGVGNEEPAPGQFHYCARRVTCLLGTAAGAGPASGDENEPQASKGSADHPQWGILEEHKGQST